MFGLFGKKSPDKPLAISPAPSNGPLTIYQYQTRRYNTPGTGNLVFKPLTTLPPYKLNESPYVVRAPLNPLQPPQLYYRHQMPIAGYGGLVAGQMARQPLVIPQG
jgi:hypothetical protein